MDFVFEYKSKSAFDFDRTMIVVCGSHDEAKEAGLIWARSIGTSSKPWLTGLRVMDGSRVLGDIRWVHMGKTTIEDMRHNETL